MELDGVVYPHPHEVPGLADIDLSKPLYVFGYGSLIWRPSFPFLSATPCKTVGFRRRFWQSSPDHRGRPLALVQDIRYTGRVCTMVPSTAATSQADSEVHGTAFLIAAESAKEVLLELGFREKAGYSCMMVPIIPTGEPVQGSAPAAGVGAAATTAVAGAGLADGSSSTTQASSSPAAPSESGPLMAYAFVGNSDNQWYVGEGTEHPHDPPTLASIIYHSQGPSGSNRQYFLELLQCMRRRGVHDPHLEAIDAELQKLLVVGSALAETVTTAAETVTTVTTAAETVTTAAVAGGGGAGVEGREEEAGSKDEVGRKGEESSGDRLTVAAAGEGEGSKGTP